MQSPARVGVITRSVWHRSVIKDSTVYLVGWWKNSFMTSKFLWRVSCNMLAYELHASERYTLLTFFRTNKKLSSADAEIARHVSRWMHPNCQKNSTFSISQHWPSTWNSGSHDSRPTKALNSLRSRGHIYQLPQIESNLFIACMICFYYNVCDCQLTYLLTIRVGFGTHVAKTPTYSVVCPFPLFVCCYTPPTLQTDRQTGVMPYVALATYASVKSLRGMRVQEYKAELFCRAPIHASDHQRLLPWKQNAAKQSKMPDDG